MFDPDEYDENDNKGPKDWDSDIVFTFRHRNVFGKYQTSKIKIEYIYQFGVEYHLIPLERGEGLSCIALAVGNIVTIKHERFINVYYRYIIELRTLLRKHLTYKIIKTKQLSLVSNEGKVIKRCNRQYLVKTEKYQKYITLTMYRNKRPEKVKRKYDSSNLIKIREESGFYKEGKNKRGKNKKYRKHNRREDL